MVSLTTIKKIVIYLCSTLITLAIGFLGSIFTINEINTWYANLSKPFFNPPNWVFGPVWTTLYILIGTAAAIVWVNKKNTKEIAPSLNIYSLQLALNFLWSVIFFGKHLITIAFIEILILWLTIILNIVLFKKISLLAALLLIPYLPWVTFAAILNFSLMILN